MTRGEFIRRKREKAGISRSVLGKIFARSVRRPIAYSKSAIEAIEREDKSYSIDTALNLERFMKAHSLDHLRVLARDIK